MHKLRRGKIKRERATNWSYIIIGFFVLQAQQKTPSTRLLQK